MIDTIQLDIEPYISTRKVIEIAEAHLEAEVEITDLIFSREMARAAFDKLEGGEREKIAWYARAIVAKVSRELPISLFDFDDALEVLFKLGVFLNLKGTKAA